MHDQTSSVDDLSTAAGTGQDAHRTDTRATFVFRIGPTWLGVPAQHVTAVLDSRLPMPLPRVPPYILGLIPSGRQALPVLDLGLFLDLPRADAAGANRLEMPRLVVIADGARTAAVPVDRALGVVAVPRADEQPPGTVCTAATQPFALCEIELTHGIAAVLDLPHLLDAVSV